jgi:diadenosine tetraphosphatase ApaH/serine/threonine PP2A family protein phosphatase
LKVAALYDVHAMPVALETALGAAGEEGADVVLFGGDLIHGPCPRRAVELARGLPGARFVRGNCEREPDEWDLARLDEGTLGWLAGLPLTASIDGVLYCHATPADDMPMTTAITPDDALLATFGGLDERVVVIGHTHHQFDRSAEGVRVVNAGSVGMPYEDEVAVFWALVEDGEPSLRRTPLDVEAAAAEIRGSGWPSGEEFVAENLLVAQSRDAAIAHFEGLRA